MFRGSEEQECPYFESDAPEMLNKLLEKGLLKLSESTHSKEIGRINNPKYCRYHRISSHPIEKCKAFKVKILQLAMEGKITLDEEDTKKSD